jgi:hypothetical protein
MTIIEHGTESITVRANGGRKTIIKLEAKAGKVKQISYRAATELAVRLIVKIDGEYEILYPTGTQIITNHVMTSQYAPHCYFAHKSAGSPYGYTSTYEIEFDDNVEVVILNEGTSNCAITDVFIVAEIYTEEYEKDVWGV